MLEKKLKKYAKIFLAGVDILAICFFVNYFLSRKWLDLTALATGYICIRGIGAMLRRTYETGEDLFWEDYDREKSSSEKTS